jgi:hypothetical protein
VFVALIDGALFSGERARRVFVARFPWNAHGKCIEMLSAAEVA